MEKVIGFLFLIPSSMLPSVSALGAQNIGAGRRDRTVLTLRYAIVLVSVPGAIFTSTRFPTTLLPMGLATAAGSLLSVIVCVIAYTVLRRKEKQTLT